MPQEVAQYKTRLFLGSADGWGFVIVDFSIAAQGFPAEDRGVDGTARHDARGIVLHLTRELAERAVELALVATGGN